MRLVLTASVAVVITAASISTQIHSVPQPDSVFLEDLTWMEVRDAIAGGKTTVIVPTGGTEQNGPHMALVQGRSNRETARERARRPGRVVRSRGRHQPAHRPYAFRGYDLVTAGRLRQRARTCRQESAAAWIR
jgi:hypothetical protein